MAHALDGFAIEGIRHNIPFLAALMHHPRSQGGRLSTSFIAQEFPEGFAEPAATGPVAWRMVAVAAAIDHVQAARRARIGGRMREGRPPGLRERVATIEGESLSIEVDEAQGEVQVTAVGPGGRPGEIATVRATWRPGEAVWRGVVDGEAVAMVARAITGGTRLTYRGSTADIRIQAPRVGGLARLMPARPKAEAGQALMCPMPGLVRSIEVKEGQEVKAGEALCIVEAMKMENVLRAPRDAVVKTILAKVGDILAVDAVIMDFAD